jgi:hypothetical protein
MIRLSFTADRRGLKARVVHQNDKESMQWVENHVLREMFGSLTEQRIEKDKQ